MLDVQLEMVLLAERLITGFLRALIDVVDDFHLQCSNTNLGLCRRSENEIRLNIRQSSEGGVRIAERAVGSFELILVEAVRHHFVPDVASRFAKTQQLRSLLVQTEVPGLGIVQLADFSQVNFELVLEAKFPVGGRDEEDIPLAVLAQVDVLLPPGLDTPVGHNDAWEFSVWTIECRLLSNGDVIDPGATPLTLGGRHWSVFHGFDVVWDQAWRIQQKRIDDRLNGRLACRRFRRIFRRILVDVDSANDFRVSIVEENIVSVYKTVNKSTFAEINRYKISHHCQELA